LILRQSMRFCMSFRNTETDSEAPMAWVGISIIKCAFVRRGKINNRLRYLFAAGYVMDQLFFCGFKGPLDFESRCIFMAPASEQCGNLCDIDIAL